MDLEFAYTLWKQLHFAEHASTDETVKHLLMAESKRGWLRKARLASLLSSRQVAKNMKVSNSTYLRYERDEDHLPIHKIKKCAEAMGCELIYALRPKEKIPFARKIWKVLLANLKPQSNERQIVEAAKNKMSDPVFRKHQGWGPNTDPEGREIARFYARTRAPAISCSIHRPET